MSPAPGRTATPRTRPASPARRRSRRRASGPPGRRPCRRRPAAAGPARIIHERFLSAITDRWCAGWKSVRCRWRRFSYPAEEAPVAAVHRLPAGHELQEEDAEREHVRLLVDDAVRVVLRRQAPDQQETTPSSFHSHGPWPFAFVLFFDSIKSKSGLPEGAFDGRDRPVRPL